MVGRKPPLISVLLPVYNAQETVLAAVNSIQGQDFGDWELVAVDDGSTDASGETLDALARDDERIRIVHRGHAGIVGALQTAVAQARGIYFARMDADDVCRPERFSRQLRCLERNRSVGLCGGRVQMVGGSVGSGRRRYEEWINSLVDHEDISREILVECPIPHPTFMLSRSWYERVGGYVETDGPEDYDLVLRLWAAGAQFAKPETVILDWRDHPRRLSMTDPRYGEPAFRAMKRHYFSLAAPAQGRAFYQWGAGEVGKRWLREWGDDAPTAVVDINPRKIGRNIHGTRVIQPEQLPGPDRCFVAVMVGTPGARDEIRAFLNPRGFREGTDYRFLA